MSMYVSISINNENPIHTFYAHCLAVDEKGIGTYEVGEYIKRGVYASKQGPLGTITHKRSDGAEELAMLVIRFVKEHRRQE